MSHNLPDDLLLRLSRTIAVKTALHFPKERWKDLERKAGTVAKKFGYPDIEEFTSYLESSPLTVDQIEILASHLTVSETYFWREPQSFEALEQKILPKLIRSRMQKEKRLRIWSAGCSSGEEPYSIAIALKRLIPDIKDWNITILATDINPRTLKKAMRGIYGKWSFRNAPDWLQGKYFHDREDEKHEILPEIKKMVTFAHLNLAEANYPSPLNNTNAMDIIFCRNVLMYFTGERVKQVIHNLHHSLADGGWLIVSSSELSQQVFSQFTSVNYPGAIVYLKDHQKTKMLKPVPFAEVPQLQKHFHLPLKPVHKIEKIKPVLPEIKKEDIKETESPLPGRSNYEEALNSYSQGSYAEVIDTLEHHAATPEEFVLLIRALANQNKLTEAIAQCERVIAINKLHPGLHFLFATILQEHNQFSKAITSLNHVIYLDPNSVLAYYTMGNIFLRQGGALRAKRSFENALALLKKCNDDDIVPESEGLTAGRLREIINATIKSRVLS